MFAALLLLQLVAPAAEGESGRWLLLERTPEKNMDDPSTLSSFIAKGIGNFRADKYMVNLNDHGGSWTGFGGDYSHMIDHLGNVGADNGAEANSFFYLDAMRDAIKTGMAAGFTQQGDPTPEDRKVDIIGFDACLMSEYAVIKTLGPMAHYFLASEENEPGHGWDYAYLKPVDGGGVARAGAARRVAVHVGGVRRCALRRRRQLRRVPPASRGRALADAAGACIRGGRC